MAVVEKRPLSRVGRIRELRWPLQAGGRYLRYDCIARLRINIHAPENFPNSNLEDIMVHPVKTNQSRAT